MEDVTIQQIFEAIPTRFNGSAAGDWKAHIQFVFNDDGVEANWFISVEDGSCNSGEGTVDTPTATVRTAGELWLAMVTGKADPMQAFMEGKIKVEGNMADVMKLQDQSIFKRV